MRLFFVGYIFMERRVQNFRNKCSSIVDYFNMSLRLNVFNNNTIDNFISRGSHIYTSASLTYGHHYKITHYVICDL